MAESECSASLTLEGAILSEPTITNSDPNIQLSKTSTELVRSQIQPEELHKSYGEVTHSEKVLEDDSHIKAISRVPVSNNVANHLTLRSAVRPHSIAEVHISEGIELQFENNHRNEQVILSENASSSHKDLREKSLAPAKFSVQRSQSDTLQIQKESSAPLLHYETSGSTRLETKNQEPSVQSLVCKQAMQLHQSNNCSTFCRAGSPTQQSCYMCGPGPAQLLLDLSLNTKHTRFQEPVCCSSCNHGTLEETFAAYCHPQPIPAPAQLLPRLSGLEGDCRGQVGGPALLSLPPLISSVSETGLDTKRLIRCCNLDCNWPDPLHHTGSKQVPEEVRSVRDAETMTSSKQVRDVGVQVGVQVLSERPPQHVFPEVCLVEEKNGIDKPSGPQKSPVKEVKWDAEGMTWEVYGASVDPEELGVAIQRHLELQIKETAVKAAKLSRQETNTSQNSGGRSHQRRRGLMSALSPPGCCTSTSTAVD